LKLSVRKKFLYRISQKVNNGYDTYDSAVVVATSEDDARTIHPHAYENIVNDKKYWSNDWVEYNDRHEIKVEYIGVADSEQLRGVILASFNAG